MVLVGLNASVIKTTLKQAIEAKKHFFKTEKAESKVFKLIITDYLVFKLISIRLCKTLVKMCISQKKMFVIKCFPPNFLHFTLTKNLKCVISCDILFPRFKLLELCIFI